MASPEVAVRPQAEVTERSAIGVPAVEQAQQEQTAEGTSAAAVDESEGNEGPLSQEEAEAPLCKVPSNLVTSWGSLPARRVLATELVPDATAETAAAAGAPLEHRLLEPLA